MVRLGIGTSKDAKISNDVNWVALKAIADRHGLSAIVLDGLNEVLKTNSQLSSLNSQLKLSWIGATELQRLQYQHSWKVACKLDKLWSAEGIHATVLKGRSIAKYYPVPSHRYSCDLDVFIGGEWGRACELLEGQGIRLEHEVYKEVEFTLDNVYVECHRYITPVRGNKHLKEFERYLRSLLDGEPKECFEGTTLVCPPLMFTVLLYIEHALGDLLHGHLTLKHIVDWVVLRRQPVDWDAFKAKCMAFKFDKFLPLIDALADVVEGKKEYDSLQPAYREIFDEMFQGKEPLKQGTWFQRRIRLFFDIIKNGKKFHDYGYTSMPSFLFNGVWAHFFDKEVNL